MTEPPNWRKVRLDQIFTRQQIKDVVLIINYNPDSHLRIMRLKAYLDPINKQLIEKGFDPDFLAYALEHITRGKA
jgi:hypothetical protein